MGPLCPIWIHGNPVTLPDFQMVPRLTFLISSGSKKREPRWIGPSRCSICFSFIMINSLYMFQAPICSSSGGTVYTTIGIFCVYFCTYSAFWWWADKCSKHVEAINCNKLKANSASSWSYYTEQGLCLQQLNTWILRFMKL
jgi:hypothetical protein